MVVGVVVPPGVVRVMVVGPGGWGGETAEISVSEMMVKFAALVVPNWTVAVLVSAVPLIVMVVAPVVGPSVGVIEVMVGAAMAA